MERTRLKVLCLGRKEPDYSVDIDDLFEINMIEAEKEMLRREHAEGKIKSHPSIIFSMEYNQGDARKDNIYYLGYLGLIKNRVVRSSMNPNYIKHLTVIKYYENLREGIGSAVECKERHPQLWKAYRISKICVDRYNRFFTGN